MSSSSSPWQQEHISSVSHVPYSSMPLISPYEKHRVAADEQRANELHNTTTSWLYRTKMMYLFFVQVGLFVVSMNVIFHPMRFNALPLMYSPHCLYCIVLRLSTRGRCHSRFNHSQYFRIATVLLSFCDNVCEQNCCQWKVFCVIASRDCYTMYSTIMM